MNDTSRLARWRVPALLFLGAFAARFFSAACSQCICSDGPEYAMVAAKYFAGDWSGGLAHTYHPLYPLAMAAAHLLFSSWEQAGQAVSVLAAALGVLPLYGLTRRLFDEPTAIAAAVLYVFSPYPVRLSAEVLTTGLYLGLTLTALWAAVEGWSTGRWPWLFLSGVAAGLAYLTRVDGLILAAGLCGWTMVLNAREWKDAPLRRGACLLAFAAGVLLTSAPYVNYLSADADGFIVTRKTNAATFTSQLMTSAPEGMEDGDAPPPDNDKLTPHVLIDKVYGSAFEKWLAAAGRVFVESSSACPWALLAFLWLGVWVSLRPGPTRTRVFAVLSVPLVFEVALWVFSATHYRESKRYTTPIMVWLLPWSALGMTWCAGQAARFRSGMLTARTMLALMLAAFALGHITKTFRPPGKDKRGEKEAGFWIRAHASGPGPTIVSSVPRVVFYADGKGVWLLSTTRYTPEKIVAAMREAQAQYLVVDGGLERNCEEFFAWVKNAGQAELTLVYSTETVVPDASPKDVVRVYAPVGK